MQHRLLQAKETRNSAAELAASRIHPEHRNNGEEYHYRKQNGDPSHIANFTKCLPHDPITGLLLDHHEYAQWVKSIDSGDPQAIEKIRIGPHSATDPDGRWKAFVNVGGVDKPVINWEWPPNNATPTDVRGWESQGAGRTYDLQGPDSHALTMPPAPRLDSQELIAEMAEVYWMALLRDVPFSEWSTDPQIAQARQSLGEFYWFAADRTDRLSIHDLSPAAQARRRILVQQKGQSVPLERFMRGVGPGVDVGPYLSQFLLLGNTGINKGDAAQAITDGLIAYGGLRVNQRVRVATPGKNYMTDWDEWVDVQNGAKVNGRETYQNAPADAYRFMHTPRDLATYVHYDALYEAYLNACLLLFGMDAPFDPGLPFRRPDWKDKQLGFAQFGGPHILSLVTEVATRALKAVRYQKFNTHRRVRPEGVGGLLHQWQSAALPEAAALDNLLKAFNGNSGLTPLIMAATGGNLLLPMAFPEGSPSHPSYGAGHATVAGACVTLLKAYFDAGWELPLHDGSGAPIAYETDPLLNGQALRSVPLDRPLTVEGELNKIAANIAIGRDWAGVHYYTDYIESFRLGEQVALGLLEEQKLQYGETFSMTAPLLDGTAARI
ncbi:MAG: vanadium-dependent haloperoxidase [Gammaproteobacteria bacterium]|nr:vanadium-dependent haloperoxidase [Gammaproteobacteria bacterium]